MWRADRDRAPSAGVRSLVALERPFLLNRDEAPLDAQEEQHQDEGRRDHGAKPVDRGRRSDEDIEAEALAKEHEQAEPERDPRGRGDPEPAPAPTDARAC